MALGSRSPLRRAGASTVALEGPELVLLSPGTANAAALGRSGSELVYRSEPGQRDDLFFQDDADTLDVSGHDVGDEPVHCACACTAAHHGRRAALAEPQPQAPVWVFIRTRTGSDRAEVIFASRLG